MKMPRTQPGEIWTVDLGLAGKVRPCDIISDYPADDELALLVVIPHTTALRANRWEFPLPKAFLTKGAFHLQQIQAVPITRLERKLGLLTGAEFQNLRYALVQQLRLLPGT
jgi:mRNA interferase MazF